MRDGPQAAQGAEEPTAAAAGTLAPPQRAMGEFGAVSVISGNIIGQTQTLTLYVESAYKVGAPPLPARAGGLLAPPGAVFGTSCVVAQAAVHGLPLGDACIRMERPGVPCLSSQRALSCLGTAHHAPRAKLPQHHAPHANLP